MTLDTGHVTLDTWNLTRDTWQMTPDMWHVVGGEHSLKMSPLQLSRFGCNDVLKVWRKMLTDWLTVWISDETVCRTAPAIPGVEITCGAFYFWWLSTLSLWVTVHWSDWHNCFSPRCVYTCSLCVFHSQSNYWPFIVNLWKTTSCSISKYSLDIFLG